MFGTQDMAMPLLPGAQPQIFCPVYWHTGVCWRFYPTICFYYPTRCHFGYITFTITIYEQVQACGPLSQGPPVVAGPGGDPVEALQALRRQLEVALAGVRAQEEELRRQRAAGEGGAQRGGARGGG